MDKNLLVIQFFVIVPLFTVIFQATLNSIHSEFSQQNNCFICFCNLPRHFLLLLQRFCKDQNKCSSEGTVSGK